MRCMEFGRRSVGRRCPAGFRWQRRRRDSRLNLFRDVLGHIRIVRHLRRLGGRGDLPAGELVHQVLDGLALRIGRPRVLIAARCASGLRGRLLLDRRRAGGRQGIKGRDEVKHGFARRGRLLLLRWLGALGDVSVGIVGGVRCVATDVGFGFTLRTCVLDIRRRRGCSGSGERASLGLRVVGPWSVPMKGRSGIQ